MKRLLTLVCVAAAVVGSFAPAVAQDAQPETNTPLEQIVRGDISEESLALGLQLVKLSGNSETFNVILPNVADQAKNAFVRANPQMQLGIIDIVDRVALSLINRRPDLDNALARVWASGFTNEEMQELIEFYSTDVGKKYAELHPKLLGVQMATAQEWGKAISQELTAKVSAELRAAIAAEEKALQGDIAGPAAETPAPAQ
jgi:uncharacterized protein